MSVKIDTINAVMDGQQQPPHPPWLDQKKPGREDAVLPFMLERNAR